jgi:hypothetical protein
MRASLQRHSLLRKTEGDQAMKGPQQRITKDPARGRRARSSLVRRLVQANDDPAKQRMRRWLSDVDDERLLSFGLTPERHRPPARLTLFWQLRLFSSDVRSIRTLPTGFMVLEH